MKTMKRLTALILVLAMALSLCACGKSDKAKKAEKLIDAIGTVTRDSGRAIEKAQSYYDSLNRSEKNEVGNYKVLKAAAEEYEELQTAAYKLEMMQAISEALGQGRYDQVFDLVTEAKARLGDDADLRDAWQEAYSAAVASMIETAKAYAAGGDYTIAIEYLGKCLAQYPNDAELEDALSGIRFDYQAEVRSSALESARDAAARNDYDSAIDTLNRALAVIPCDAELEAMLSVYRSSYQDALMQQAEAAYASEGYEAAVAVLKRALELFPEHEAFREALAYYESCAPVYLMDIEPIAKSVDGALFVIDDVTGLTGIHYGKGLCGHVFRGIGDSIYWNQYLVNKEYSTLSFRVVLQRADFADSFTPSITVYGDGNQELCTVKVTKYDIDPIDVTVDISDQTYVKIMINATNYRSYPANDVPKIIAMVDARFEK